MQDVAGRSSPMRGGHLRANDHEASESEEFSLGA
jgi:hypothetical protein